MAVVLTEQTKRFVKVIEHLESKGLVQTRAQLAKDLDYSPQSLNEIIHGRRNAPIEVIHKIVTRFKVNLYYLFDGSPPMFVEMMHEIINQAAEPKAEYGGMNEVLKRLQAIEKRLTDLENRK